MPSLLASGATILNETAANEMFNTVERQIYQGDVTSGSVPSPLAVDPYFETASGYNFHDDSGGSYDIDVGLNDSNPATPATDINLVDVDADANLGVDLSGLDNTYQSWTYDTPTAFESYNFDDYSYGDNWEPVILDLNGDGIRGRGARHTSVYFDVDGDSY